MSALSLFLYIFMLGAHAEIKEARSLKAAFIGLIIGGLVSLVCGVLIGSGEARGSKYIGIIAGIAIAAPWLFQFGATMNTLFSAFG